MAYKFSVSAMDGYIRVDVSGERLPASIAADSMAVWQAVLEKHRVTGVGNVLYVSSVTGQIPVMDAYDVVEAFGQQNWSALKIAYATFDEDSMEDIQMLKAIALQYGIHGDLFSSEEDALAWLLDPTT